MTTEDKILGIIPVAMSTQILKSVMPQEKKRKKKTKKLSF